MGNMCSGIQKIVCPDPEDDYDSPYSESEGRATQLQRKKKKDLNSIRTHNFFTIR